MRLFIAMPLPDEIEELLGKAVFVLKQKRTRVKWVAPKNIHLTLKFLGETDEEKVASISDSIRKVAEKYNTVHSRLDKLGAFPNLNRPRVVWAGLSDGIDILTTVASDIETEMARLGFEKENRPFRCHLTLGRVKDNFNLAELADAISNYELTPTDVTFSSIDLFKSTLTPRGPIYDRLFEAELKD